MELFDKNIGGLPPVSEAELSDDGVLREIRSLKARLGDQVVILAHHYQNDDIVNFADATGDSLELARGIRHFKDAGYIIFCGVHFMAETAAMLAVENQSVILPDPEAGCFLADTAGDFEVNNAWSHFSSCTRDKIIPITYINSTASLKAIVGRNNGAICTSSNALKVITWALKQGQKLFFLPDQHLGRNTCFRMGIPLEKMVVYDPSKPGGGLSCEAITNAQILLWYGYCSVHQGFTTKQIDYVRKNDPGATVIVHPECPFDVVNRADLSGSTSYIISQIEKAAKGTHFAVGTEINLVTRLSKKFSDKKIYSLSPYQCLCTTMYRIRPRWLLASLRSIDRGRPENVITVKNNIKEEALRALNRMMELS